MLYVLIEEILVNGVNDLDAEPFAVKLRAFIADELRDWEKTFPDELWEEFGRLTNWQGALQHRPKW